MVREKIMRTKMEQKEKGQHFSKTINKFTIQSVTTLIGRIKKCQAYSNDVLESKTKANGVKNKNGLLDKNAEEKKAFPCRAVKRFGRDSSMYNATTIPSRQK